MKRYIRKSFLIAPVLESVNSYLKDTLYSSDIRQGMIMVIINALYEAHNYAGYRYLNETEVPEGQLPSVWKSKVAGVPPSFENTDSTRRLYHTKRNEI